MARRANRSPDEVVDLAMREFWARGFNSASMDSLVRDIGTTRFSLYREFGGKDALFEAALDRYAKVVVTKRLRPLAGEACGLAGLRRYFEGAIASLERDGRLSDGCLMTNTMTEVGADARRINERTRAHFDRIAGMFRRALSSARERGELAEHVDVNASSIALATFAQGLWASARSGIPAAELRKAVRATLRTLGSPGAGTGTRS